MEDRSLQEQKRDLHIERKPLSIKELDKELHISRKRLRKISIKKDVVGTDLDMKRAKNISKGKDSSKGTKRLVKKFEALVKEKDKLTTRKQRLYVQRYSRIEYEWLK